MQQLLLNNIICKAKASKVVIHKIYVAYGYTVHIFTVIILSTSYRYKGFALIKIPSGGKPPEPPIPRFTRNQRGGG